MIYYLDASAWLKRHLVEPGHDTMIQWFSQSPRAACSTLAPVEVVATLARKLQAGGITSAAFGAIRQSVDEERRSLTLVSLGPDVLSVALGLPEHFPLRGADTVHLASAITLRSRANDDVTLVTSDRELAGAATVLGFDVLNPETS